MSDVLALCLRDDVLNMPALEGLRRATDEDPEKLDFIVQLILSFSQYAQGECNRLFRTVEREHLLDVDGESCRTLSLPAYPIVMTATIELREAPAGDYSGVTPMAATDYGVMMNGKSGLIRRRSGYWPEGAGTVKVKWTGGVATRTELVPRDLRMACAMQVAQDFERNPTLHLRSEATESGGATFYDHSQLLPQTRAVLNNYRRVTM